jgi:serine/threonine-protein kinase
MPVSADLGPLAAVLERAGRPLPEDRYSAAEFGRALVQSAEKLPRPAPISLPHAGLFGDSSGAIARPPLPPPDPVVEMPLDEAHPSSDDHDPTRVDQRPVAEDSSEVAPERRRGGLRWVVPLLLVLAAVAGGITYFVTRDKTHTYVVPHLTGLTESEALNQISGFGWETVVTREASDEVAAGVVIRTQPPEATSIEENEPFQLIVSTGPAPRPLPELVGLTLDQAKAGLEGLGLVLVQAPPAFDETVVAGTVISWMVPEQPGLKAGDTVTPMTAVSVVLSKGPEPRVVPDLTGVAIDQATATLAAEGLVLAQVDPQFSDAVAVGLIVAQDVAPNTKVDRGATISVAVSKGPDVVAVVPLANLTLQQTTDALTAAGLTVGAVNGNPDGVLVGAQYQGVDILPGQLLPRGSAIDITLA